MSRKSTSEGASPTIHARIALLAERIWMMNQSAMARDLRVEQSTISKVLAGRQQPGAALLERLASWPRVNPAWLMSARGEPLYDVAATSSAGLYLPLVDELLKVPPAAAPEQLSGISYPVAGAYYSNTAYWFRVPANHVITFAPVSVRSHDLLLMTAERRLVGSIVGVCGRIVVIRHPQGGRPALAQVGTDEEMVEGVERYRLEVFGEPGRTWFVSGEVPRKIVGKAKSEERFVTFEDILAVCLLLERRFKGTSR